jgi:hypothetical protein
VTAVFPFNVPRQITIAQLADIAFKSSNEKITCVTIYFHDGKSVEIIV